MVLVKIMKFFTWFRCPKLSAFIITFYIQAVMYNFLCGKFSLLLFNFDNQNLDFICLVTSQFNKFFNISFDFLVCIGALLVFAKYILCLSFHL